MGTVRSLQEGGIRRSLRDVNFYYGWVIVGAYFLIGLITWEIVWSFGVFFGYFVDEFGLSHTNTSIVFSLGELVVVGGFQTGLALAISTVARFVLWDANELAIPIQPGSMEMGDLPGAETQSAAE